MVAVEEAIDIVLSQTVSPSAQDVDEVPLRNCLGRVLSENIYSPIAVPPVPTSVMDGFAVVASDGAGCYPVVGQSTAGGLHPVQRIVAGQIAYITTGGALPAGADAVQMIEKCVPLDPTSTSALPVELTPPYPSPMKCSFVRIREGVKPGTFVRAPGSDVAKGALIASAGQMLSSAAVGLLSSVGISKVRVYSLPRVAILSTGNELTDVPETFHGDTLANVDRSSFPESAREGDPTTGDTASLSAQSSRNIAYDSNRPMLSAALAECLPKPIVLDAGVAKDEPHALEAAMRNAMHASDIVIITGGVR